MSDRIEGYDLARVWAIVGMVIVNFKIATGADKHDPTLLLTAMGWLDGRAAATFVVLAGCGLTMLTDRVRREGDAEGLVNARKSLFKRAAFLFVAGLAYTPIWPADILHFYGLYIAIGACLVAASAPVLWAVALSSVMAFMGMLFTFDYERGWNFDTLEYSGFWTPAGMVRHLFYNGFHPVLPWVAFLLVGLWLARQNLLAAPIRRRLLLWGLCIWGASEMLSWGLIAGLTPQLGPGDAEDLRAVFGTEPMPPVLLYMTAAGGLAVAVVVACIGFMEQVGARAWTRPLIYAGQMSLTIYVAHVIVGMGTLEAMGRLGGQTPLFAFGAATIFSVLAVLFAWTWRQYFARGPFEWLLRRLTA